MQNYSLFDLNGMYGRNPYPQPMFQPQPQPVQFVTRQVSNIEEAKACLIDPLSTFLFIDMNAGKIYMKRMNNNGLSDFFSFTVEENVKQAEKVNPLDLINERLSNIEKALGGKYESISNDESKSNELNDKSVDKSNAKTKSSVVQ